MAQWKLYRKTAPTVARLLTEADVQARGGIIQTLEGPKHFGAGDYLARDAKGEWPIRKAVMEDRGKYEPIDSTEEEGWMAYQPVGLREAQQMDEVFTTNGLTGKPGDYLVRTPGQNQRMWVVDREIFESTCTPVEQVERA